MNWLIDGYNVLISNELGHDESARDRLRQKIEAHFFKKQVTVTVVYDSRGSTSVQRRKITPAISEVYVNDADRYIVNLVRKSPNPRSIILVTDDVAGIVSPVRSLGPKLVNTADFLALLSTRRQGGSPPEKPEWETPENIERYLRLLGEE